MRWLLLALLCLSPAYAAPSTPLTTMKAGPEVISSAPTYTGPGDVVSGATAFWGLRGYNAAYSGAAVNACLPSDSTCADVTISAGNLVIPAGLSTCNNSTVICTVKILYDQTGGGNCGGTCNLTESTIANRPTFVLPGASNGCPSTANYCMIFTVAQCFPATGGSMNVTQAFTISAVAKRITYESSFDALLYAGNTTAFNWAGSSPANVQISNEGSGLIANASIGSWHAFEAIANGASSSIWVDGTQTSGSSTSSAFNGAVMMNNSIFSNCPSGPFPSALAEVGIWPSNFGASASTMNTNQHTYWGF